MIDREEYEKWNEEFVEAMTKTVSNREEKLAEINEKIDIDLELIGSTAIEDKLQD